jgi:hypothetical protein
MKKLIIPFFLLFIINQVYSEELVPFNSSGKIIVAEDKTPLYEKPIKKSKVLVRLSITHEVKLIDNKTIQVNGKPEKWCYIDSGTLEEPAKLIKGEYGWESVTYKGWVLEENLAGKNNFKLVSKVEEMFILVRIPDTEHQYHFYIDGTVKYRRIDSLELLNARLYQFRNIYTVALRVVSKDIFSIWLVLDEKSKSLSSPFFEVEVIKDKKKFPF